MGLELAPLATVLAALIAAAISFVSLTLNKEQKTSEFRQAWIDGLRSDLATFFTAIRAFARATQEHNQSRLDDKPAGPFSFTEEAISKLRQDVAEMRYRIQFRLNQNETNHIELLRLMKVAVEKQQMAIHGMAKTEEVLAAVEVAADFAPQVLKAEWERVKHGELPFRIVRNWVAPLVILLSIAFVIVLLLRGEKPNSAIERAPTGKPVGAAHVER
ncbi:MAG: hypothetical protein V4447_04995 [Pseudomonadota bacterium]